MENPLNIVGGEPRKSKPIPEFTRVVWKYELDDVPGRRVRIDLPAGAELLSAGCQGSGVFIWVLVNPGTQAVEERTFVYFCTGDAFSMSPNFRFVATVTITAADPNPETKLRYNGGEVLHVFEVLNGN